MPSSIKCSRIPNINAVSNTNSSMKIHFNTFSVDLYHDTSPES